MSTAELSAWGIHDMRNDGGGPTGCGYYRVVLPFRALREQLGWKIHFQAGTPPPKVAEYRVITGERLDNAEMPPMWRNYRLRHKLVYELDDNLWAVNPVNTNAWNFYRSLHVQDMVEEGMRISHLVTVTNETLADVVRKKAGIEHVAVLPNFIEKRLLSMQRKRRERLTLGWVGGGSHALDMALMALPVRHVMDKTPGVDLHIIGTDFRPTIGHNHAYFTPWEPDPAKFFDLLDFDIGLAPLAADEFNESKSYLKPLEYAALGIPVIASDFGPYHEFVRDGETGFLVRTQKQWREKLRLLIADADLRETMGTKARELAAQHTIEDNAWRWAEAYKEIL